MAKSNFYGNQSRQDAVMIESCQSSLKFLATTHTSIWFAKVLICLRLDSFSRRLCFVKHYQIFSRSDLEVGDVDAVFNCVCIQRHQNQGNLCFELDLEYILVPVGIVQERVHIVNADFDQKLLSQDRSQNFSTLRAYKPEEVWSSRLFYVNRFYNSKKEEFSKK